MPNTNQILKRFAVLLTYIFHHFGVKNNWKCGAAGKWTHAKISLPSNVPVSFIPPPWYRGVRVAATPPPWVIAELQYTAALGTVVYIYILTEKKKN